MLDKPTNPVNPDQLTAEETRLRTQYLQNCKKAKAHIITSMSPEIFMLVQSLARPDNIAEDVVSYERIKKLLIDHLDPKPTVLAERFRFYHTSQGKEESTSSYVARLRDLASRCGFTDFSARMLDQFIMGLQSREAQEHLLQCDLSGLTMNTAFEKVCAMDRSRKEALNFRMNDSPSTSEVHRLENLKVKTCDQCGLKGHLKKDCKIKCHACKEVGHVRKNCSSNKKKKPTKTQRKKWKHKVNQVEHSESETENFVGESLYFCEEVQLSSEYLEEDINADLYNMPSTANDYAECFASDDLNGSNTDDNTEYIASFDCMADLHDNIENMHEIASNILVEINDRSLNFEFDSGASITVISENQLSGMDLNKIRATKRLKVANGEIVEVLYKVLVKAKIDGMVRKDLMLYVVKGHFPSLLGRDWITQFWGTDWLQKVRGFKPAEVFKTEEIRSIDELKKSLVFNDELGQVKNEAKLILKEGITPVSQKTRSVPFAIKAKVEKELTAMVKQGVLAKVEQSPWGTPVHPVKKGDSVRICGDFKAVNERLETKQYPLPTVEECFAAVTGGQKFSVIDIKQAYNNIPIRKDDQLITTMNTHLGQYYWTRLPYGISSSAGIFQELMDETLSGISMVCCRIDDILVSGKTEQEHLKNLNDVITRLERCNFRCKLSKSQFMRDEVIYLGHRVSKEGISPVRSKIDDLKNANPPRNVKDLVSFLGAVGYYRKYLPDLSTIIAPLEALRKKDVEWRWTTVEHEAYEKLKDMLCSDQVLTFYDPGKSVKLDTDASSYGLGAVLSHVDDDGNERPIEYISRTLSDAEKRYSQIDKEALSIIWSIKRFNRYLLGRHFTLVTDHQPLVQIFGKKKLIPEMTANRLARYAVFMQNYDYSIQYRNTKSHANADVLSRFPKQVSHPEDNVSEDVFQISCEESLLDARKVAMETAKDPFLKKILMFIQEGWPRMFDDSLEYHPEFRSVSDRREQLNCEHGCITWGNRVIVPPTLRDDVLKILHTSHVGMSAMKAVARSHVWWNQIDQQIEFLVKACEHCQKHGKKLPKTIDHPWTRPTRPWQRVHIDFAGPFQGHMWLLLYDAYSKWGEVIKMNKDTTAKATIKALRRVFCSTGLPWVLVSDNGPQFISEEFKEFLRNNMVEHILCPSYSPKSNGSCERFVQTFKSSMRKMHETSKDVDLNVASFLLSYRNTPHSVTNQAPAMLLCGRTLRSKLNCIRPSETAERHALNLNNERKVLEKRRPEVREFIRNQPVWIRPDNSKEYVPAVVQQKSGNWYYVYCQGRSIRKHVDAIKNREVRPIAEPNHIQAPSQPVENQQYTSQSPQQPSTVSAPTSSTLESAPTPPTLEATSQPAINSQTTNPAAQRVSARLRSKDRVDYKSLNG